MYRSPYTLPCPPCPGTNSREARTLVSVSFYFFHCVASRRAVTRAFLSSLLSSFPSFLQLRILTVSKARLQHSTSLPTYLPLPLASIYLSIHLIDYFPPPLSSVLFGLAHGVVRGCPGEWMGMVVKEGSEGGREGGSLHHDRVYGVSGR